MAVHIDKELCKSCKICKNHCPKNVFEITNQVNKKGYNYMQAARPEDCILCRQCEMLCPDMAIFIQ